MIKLSFSTSQREMAAFLFISVNYSHYIKAWLWLHVEHQIFTLPHSLSGYFCFRNQVNWMTQWTKYHIDLSDSLVTSERVVTLWGQQNLVSWSHRLLFFYLTTTKEKNYKFFILPTDGQKILHFKCYTHFIHCFCCCCW